ncbi:hypothetical protein [Roseivirga pacifica]|uniref:hypothetical protein n=1 Tax=Roseivirga pacifica TaxID=1267423 RepID=UPI003BAC3B20
MKNIIIRDEIHGDIRLDSLSSALLDTGQMQRLGRIYQLGFAHLVFRGGNHTRLSHVVGTAHMAGIFVDNLKLNYQNANKLPKGVSKPSEFLPCKGRSLEDRWGILRYIVFWGALLHDIAHIPIGHTLEDEFDKIYEKHDNFKSPRLIKIWDEKESGIKEILLDDSLYPGVFENSGLKPEDIYFAVLAICLHKETRNGETGDVEEKFKERLQAELTSPSKQGQESLSATSKEFIEKLLRGLRSLTNPFHPYMADIVGDTICADYLDYLVRDPKNVGLDALYDKRTITKFFVGKDSKGEFRMALSLQNEAGKPRLDTVNGVLDLVRQRFRFAQVIYYHKTKIATSAMLAKAFSLLDKPSEVDEYKPERIQIDQIPRHVDQMVKQRSEFNRIRKESFPSSLLDPTIGDDSLLLWLRIRAWQKLSEKKHADLVPDEIQQTLIGLSLLQGITERRLYKACFSMDAELFTKFLDSVENWGDNREKKLVDFVEKLRSNPSTRDNLEEKMCSAAKLPEGSLILYVPPRKSQAKGIETGALSDGKVVMLSNHPAIRDRVKALGESYAELWKMYVFVHPKYRMECLKLSNAIDCLLTSTLELQVEETTQIASGAWFKYIKPSLRQAAVYYQALKEGHVTEGDWQSFLDCDKEMEGVCSPYDYALRVYLNSPSGLTYQRINSDYKNPETLHTRVNKEIEDHEAINGFEGMKHINTGDESDPFLNKLDKIIYVLKKIIAEMNGTNNDNLTIS